MRIEDEELDSYEHLYRIVRATPDSPIRGVLCGDGPLFFREHYFRNRTVPCRGSDICEPCANGMCARVAGYCWFIPDGRLCYRILSVPYSGCIALREISRSSQYQWAGLQFECKRRGSTKRSAVSIAIATNIPDTAPKVHQVPCLESHLKKIWGVPSLV